MWVTWPGGGVGWVACGGWGALTWLTRRETSWSTRALVSPDTWRCCVPICRPMKGDPLSCASATCSPKPDPRQRAVGKEGAGRVGGRGGGVWVRVGLDRCVRVRDLMYGAAVGAGRLAVRACGCACMGCGTGRDVAWPCIHMRACECECGEGRLAWPTRSDMPKRVTIILAVLATRSRSLDAPVVTCPTAPKVIREGVQRNQPLL